MFFISQTTIFHLWRLKSQKELWSQRQACIYFCGSAKAIIILGIWWYVLPQFWLGMRTTFEQGWCTMVGNVWDQQIHFAKAAMRNDCFWHIVSCFLSIENADAIVDWMKSKSNMVRGTWPSLGTKNKNKNQNKNWSHWFSY